MHRAWIAAALVAVCVASAPAQTAGPTTAPTSVGFAVSAAVASTWQDGPATVVLVRGPVVVRTDDTTLSADDAVIWLEPVAGVADAQRVGIALVGNARIESAGATQTAAQLYATTTARGDVRFEAERRVAVDESASPLYRSALALRLQEQSSPQELATVASPATSQPTAPVRNGRAQTDPLANLPAGTGARIQFTQARDLAYDDEVAYTFAPVTVHYRWPDGAYAEMYAENAVAFTGLPASNPDNHSVSSVQAALRALYLEGDVRILYMPAPGNLELGEQRLNAQSAFVRLSDRSAVLTKAVLHTEDVKMGISFVLRARTLKQLSEGEYEANGVQLTTSQFARPSFAIEASKIYVHRSGSGSGSDGTGEPAPTAFRAVNPRFKFFGIPLFYLPVAGGQATGRGAPIRNIGIERRDNFGIGIETTWGLFETFGKEPPRGLDAEYRLDYYSDRGPAGGLNGSYRGGLVTETTRQAVDFQGDYDLYFVKDHGADNLGNGRAGVPYDEVRGTAGFRHQHFFPNGWQLQTQAWYVSDATFLEEWFERQFDEGEPRDVSLYLKRQQDNEAFTLLVNAQPNEVVTTADLAQEQFEVEHLPEVGYHLVGQDVAGVATVYSDNTGSALRYRASEATLAEQGYVPGQSTPGLPSLGVSGVTDETIYRGDFRQEVDFPFSLGQVKVVPYVLGRYTTYSEGPDAGGKNRVYGGVGTRFTTSFWRVDDTAYSDLFDIHRMRHVIQPELHLFAGVQNVDRNDVFIFDEPIDAINDVRAMQVAVHQRWQTKRGGPGRWHNSDVFMLNVEGDFFKNRPERSPVLRARPDGTTADDFRGRFFYSLPEASIPRNSLNVDGAWRLSDTTVIIGDLQHNLDANRLATASIGLNVQRTERLRYYLGLRYISPFNANIGTVAFDYQLTPKYILSLNQQYDFGGGGENVITSFSMSRKFDKFFMTVSGTVDRRNDESTIGFSFSPEGVPINSATVESWIPQ